MRLLILIKLLRDSSLNKWNVYKINFQGERVNERLVVEVVLGVDVLEVTLLVAVFGAEVERGALMVRTDGGMRFQREEVIATLLSADL